MEKDKIKSILTKLISKSSQIEAVAVMTRDGMPLVSRMDAEMDSGTLSAISASLLSLAERALKDMSKGDLQQVLIHGTGGFVILVGVGNNAVLSIISAFDSRLGMLLHEARLSAREIADLL
ncbi:MAG: roadblock/LC7 domain-containing protein [Xanthomonadales bacterium]|nr:roadblock/LC7 domain-containing protein [Xanthomonadales bacterium]